MNTYNDVREKIYNLVASGASQSEILVSAANACIGWPYVYAGRGENCTPSNRKNRASSERPEIISKCQVLNGDKSKCNGCKWYPNGTVLFFDCRGFIYWLYKQIGITISGAGATSQYNDNNNWAEKGPIKNMPKDTVCCVYRYDSDTGKMEHVLLYDGQGNYIHCSGEVKKVPMSKYKATHYAIPKGFNKEGGGSPMPTPEPSVQSTAVVYAENGRPVKMRAKPTTTCKTYWDIPCGTVVDVIKPGKEWTQISNGIHSGYMMSQFLKDVEEKSATETCTVYIPGLIKEQADELIAKYPGAYITVG